MTRDEAESDTIFHRRMYNCALQTAIDLERKGSPVERTLGCLYDAYAHSRSGIHQAFGVSILYAALIRVGRTGEASDLWADYTVKRRREPWPVPQHLVTSALGLGKPASQREGGL